MAETPKSPVVTSTPSAIDWNKAEEKVSQIHNHLKGFEGKPGHNPFMYYNKFVKPLVDRYVTGQERTAELYNQIMSLKVEAPTVDKFPVEIGAITGIPTGKLWDEKK